MNVEDYYKQAYSSNQSNIKMIDSAMLFPYIRSNVLDVGCGNGKTVCELREKGYEAYGCDIFKAVANKGSWFFVHNMEEKPTKQKYSLIYSVHVLEHVFDYISFLKNIRQSLADGGIFFLAVPNVYSLLSRLRFFVGDERITLGVGEIGCVENNRLEPHIRYFGTKSLKTILEKNGFVVVDCFGSRNGKRHWLNRLAGQLNFVCKKVEGELNE